MKAEEAIGASRTYVNQTVIGMGAIKGAPCKIKSTTKSAGITTIVFEWKDNEDVTHESTIQIADGVDGQDGAAGAQGPEGPQGPAGPAGADGADGAPGADGQDGADGFSPTVTVKESTSTRYVLTITTEDGSFDTPNLKGGGSGGASDLAGLDDVAIDPLTLATGNILVYNAVTQKWENAVLAITVIQNVPSQSGTLEYSGAEQSPTWLNYDNNIMTIGGTTAATNAGTYTATFTPKAGYCWSDHSTTAKNVSWSIGKAELSAPAVTDTSKTYDGTAQGPTIAPYDNTKISVTGDSATNAGNYTVEFSLVDADNYEWASGAVTSVAWSIAKAAGSVTLSKSSVTLDSTTLSDTVTVSAATGAVTVSSSDTTVATASIASDVITISSVNDTTGTATVTVDVAASTNYEAASETISVSCVFSQIFGAEWDGSASSAWTRTDAAASFVDPSPAVNNGNGSSPFDDYMPWSGMRRVEDSAAGTLVEIPKFWYKWTRTGAKMKLQISNGEQTEAGWHVSPAHADRGDGKGERDVVYVGAYHCATSTYKSTTGVNPQASQTRATFRTSIHNLGSTIWQYDYAMYWTIMMLYLVEYADWNSQAKIGYGCSDSGSVQNSGLTDSMTYHTGTNASSRTTYGHVRYRYIEGLWDNVFDWCDGIYFSSADVYCIKNPSSFSDTSGGTNVGTRASASASGVATAWTSPSTSGFEYALYPSATTSDSTYSTYDCDHCDYSASGVVLYVGGSCNQYQSRGAFCLGGNDSASVSSGSIGSRLQKLP